MKKKPTPPTPPTLAMIEVKTLAGLSSFTERRLYQLSQDGKLPTIANGQLPMIEAIRALFSWLQRDGEQLAAQKLKIATEQARRITMQNDKAEGLMMLVSDAIRQAGDAENYYFNELGRLEREMPPLVAGMEALQVHETLARFLKDLRQRSREKFQVTPTPPTP